MALKINKRRNTISQYESNCKYPSIFTLIDLAKYFQVSTDYLLAVTDEKYNSRDEKFLDLIKEFSKMTIEQKDELIKLAQEINLQK